MCQSIKITKADELPKELLSDARDLVAHAESEVSRVRRKLQDDVNLRAAVASGALPAAELHDSSRGYDYVHGAGIVGVGSKNVRIE